jgi:hypothetical protein
MPKLFLLKIAKVSFFGFWLNGLKKMHLKNKNLTFQQVPKRCRANWYFGNNVKVLEKKRF